MSRAAILQSSFESLNDARGIRPAPVKPKRTGSARTELSVLVSLTRRARLRNDFANWRERATTVLKATLAEAKWEEFDALVERYVTGDFSTVDQPEARALIEAWVWLLRTRNTLKSEDLAGSCGGLPGKAR